MPYSDPLADGEVIQVSSMKALANGMNIAVLFDQIKDMRKSISIPVILMGYMNPILQYGFEAFCKKAKEVGIDGLILPDLPLFEFEDSYGKIIKENGLDFIFLVTPETPSKRVKKLDSLSNGFLYAVSSSATTGKDKDFNLVVQYLQKLQAMRLKIQYLWVLALRTRLPLMQLLFIPKEPSLALRIFRYYLKVAILKQVPVNF